MVKIERVRKSIPAGTARKLWVKAGGRCQHEGCNKPLWKDELMKRDMNKAYISHIIGAKANGPRGHEHRSKELETEYGNLLLLCDECHNRIDKAYRTKYSEQRLLTMKREHEERIELLTSLTPDKRSHILVYCAKVGNDEVQVSFEQAALAMIPMFYPESDRPIQLGLRNHVLQDTADDYWTIQEKQLVSNFERIISLLIGRHPVQHFSVFAFAPQPLLIKLGTLLSDKYSASVYQYDRKEGDWKWKDYALVKFQVKQPDVKQGVPVILFSLSGRINREQVQEVIGASTRIWEITIPDPSPAFLTSKNILTEFRRITRQVLNQINEECTGQTLHVFPAIPISAAVEFGRLRMPKSDLPLVLYDKISSQTNYTKTLTIKRNLVDK